MEREEHKTRTITETTHHFDCDGCGKYLGSTEEHPDGWYGQIGEFVHKVYIRRWYKIHKHFCDECADKFEAKVQAALIELGYEE